MCMDVRCHHLFAADNHGYIYHWDINGYATNGIELDPPLCKKAVFLIFFSNKLRFIFNLKKIIQL